MSKIKILIYEYMAFHFFTSVTIVYFYFLCIFMLWTPLSIFSYLLSSFCVYSTQFKYMINYNKYSFQYLNLSCFHFLKIFKFRCLSVFALWCSHGTRDSLSAETEDASWQDSREILPKRFSFMYAHFCFHF